MRGRFARIAGLLVCASSVGCHTRLEADVSPVVEPTRREIVIDGLPVSYELTGTVTSAPVVVLIHGFGASLESWSDVHPAIAARHTVLRFDLKGFGLTGKPRDDRYSVHDQVSVVSGVLRALGIERSILVGHSYGGAVAFASYLELRSSGNHEVAGLVLVDAAVYKQRLPFFVVSLRNWFSRSLSNTFTTPEWRANFVLRQAFHVDRAVTPERVRRYAKYFDAPGSHYSFQKLAEQIVPPDAAELERQLHTVTVPALVLWGAADGVVPVASARRLASDLPAVTVKMIDRTGHVPHEERPDLVARLLVDFLATIR